MDDKACANCRHWVMRVENIGDCRKNAPFLVREDGPWAMRIWPNTYDIDYCDDYKKVKAPKTIKPADVEIKSSDPHDDEDDDD
ncbi:MAG: hypothetical protein D6E12_07060 [Desulfovibrio sp.]|nr:MAG: hypothetical protein D6E12_07060 [Desulfovibrio sp.]